MMLVALLVVTAVGVVGSTPARADEICLFARFEGRVNGVVRLCLLGPQGAQIDAKINSPESGVLCLGWPTQNLTECLNPVFGSGFDAGKSCLSFEQGWLDPQPPDRLILVDEAGNVLTKAALDPTRPAGARQLRSCSRT
jgi:hypothetical protein